MTTTTGQTPDTTPRPNRRGSSERPNDAQVAAVLRRCAQLLVKVSIAPGLSEQAMALADQLAAAEGSGNA